jgi:hypothetical protein
MMCDKTPNINYMAQRMLFVNERNTVFVGRLAAAYLMRHDTSLETGEFVLIAYDAMGDITHAKEKPLKEDIWRRQTC